MRKISYITVCISNVNNLEATYKRVLKYVIENANLFELDDIGLRIAKENLRGFKYHIRNSVTANVTKNGPILYKMGLTFICNYTDRVYINIYYGSPIYKDLEYIVFINKK